MQNGIRFSRALKWWVFGYAICESDEKGTNCMSLVQQDWSIQVLMRTGNELIWTSRIEIAYFVRKKASV